MDQDAIVPSQKLHANLFAMEVEAGNDGLPGNHRGTEAQQGAATRHGKGAGDVEKVAGRAAEVVVMAVLDFDSQIWYSYLDRSVAA